MRPAGRLWLGIPLPPDSTCPCGSIFSLPRPNCAMENDPLSSTMICEGFSGASASAQVHDPFRPLVLLSHRDRAVAAHRVVVGSYGGIHLPWLGTGWSRSMRCRVEFDGDVVARVRLAVDSRTV